jgi:hypothetical protein
MSKFTDYAENQLVDFLRGQTLTLPASWHFALGSAATDAAFTEVTGTSYGRAAVTRSLANFSGTQGAGTTVASTGTSHVVSNNGTITWPTAGAGGWTAATKWGLYDAATAGNCWIYGDLSSTVTVAASSAHSQAAASLLFTLGLTGGMTDYLANKMLDLIFRAQAFTWPGTTYVRLVTGTPTNSAAGIEVVGNAYARQSIASSLAALSGTQGTGTTVASTGTGGRTSNNAAITFPQPTGPWGSGAIGYQELMDASVSGNRLFWAALSESKVINAASPPPKFPIDSYSITLG